MNPLYFIAGGALDVAGIVYLLLTHFGLLAGGLLIAPIFFAIGITLWLMGVGLPPAASPWLILVLSLVLEAAIFFNWLGLQGVI